MTRRLASVAIAIVMTLAMQMPLPTALADGVAATPNRISIDNGLRGGTYQRTLNLQNDFDVDGTFQLETSGSAADWIELRTREGEPISEVDAPSGERVSLVVVVVVPDDAPNGVYDGGVGSLLILDEESTGTGTGSGVRLGVLVPLTISVSGDQVVSGTFLEVEVGDGEVGLPHRFVAVVLNSGNVGITPEVQLEILSDGDVIDSLTPPVDLIGPGDTGRLGFVWETETQRPGEYTARVAVRLGDLDLGTQERAFTLAPRGTLTRSGRLVSLQLIGDPPQPGGIARVEAQFTNTGQIESRAELVGEVYLEGVLIDTPSNPPILVLPGVVETLELFVDTEEAGTYVLQAKVNFEGQETETATLEFTVAAAEASPPPAGDGGGGGLAVVLVLGAVLLGGGGYLLARRRSDTPEVAEPEVVEVPREDMERL